MRVTGNSELLAMPRPSGYRNRVIELTFILASLLAIIGLALLLARKQAIGVYRAIGTRTALERFLRGTVDRPFAYRALIPGTIRSLDEATSGTVRAIFDRLPSWPADQLPAGQVPPEVSPIHYHLLTGVLCTCLLVYALFAYRAYHVLFPLHYQYGNLVPVLTLVVLIPFVSSWAHYLYDFAVLMFMMGLLYATVSQQHRLFLVLFAISCFNKETTLLATVAYASYFFDRLPRRQFLTYVMLQLALFTLIYAGLRLHFAANRGTGMEIWLKAQIDWFTSRSLIEFASFVFVLAFLAYRWNEKPLALRRVAVMLVPHTVLFLVGAHPNELRNVYESVPVLTLLVCRNIQLFATQNITIPAPSGTNGRAGLDETGSLHHRRAHELSALSEKS